MPSQAAAWGQLHPCFQETVELECVLCAGSPCVVFDNILVHEKSERWQVGPHRTNAITIIVTVTYQFPGPTTCPAFPCHITVRARCRCSFTSCLRWTGHRSAAGDVTIPRHRQCHRQCQRQRHRQSPLQVPMPAPVPLPVPALVPVPVPQYHHQYKKIAKCFTP